MPPSPREACVHMRHARGGQSTGNTQTRGYSHAQGLGLAVRNRAPSSQPAVRNSAPSSQPAVRNRALPLHLAMRNRAAIIFD